MTIFGANVDERGAVVWTDSESYVNGEIYTAHSSKLGIFPVSGIISFFSGPYWVDEVAKRELSECRDFDEAISRVQSSLQSAAKRNPETFYDLAVCFDLKATFGVVGFSKRYNRYLVAYFKSENNFDPLYCREISSPFVRLDDDVHDEAIKCWAQQQISKLSTTFQNATGGSLVVARLRGEQIISSRLGEFPLLSA